MKFSLDLNLTTVAVAFIGVLSTFVVGWLDRLRANDQAQHEMAREAAAHQRESAHAANQRLDVVTNECVRVITGLFRTELVSHLERQSRGGYRLDDDEREVLEWARQEDTQAGFDTAYNRCLVNLMLLAPGLVPAFKAARVNTLVVWNVTHRGLEGVREVEQERLAAFLSDVAEALGEGSPVEVDSTSE